MLSFVGSAQVEKVRKLAALGVLDGVTTNPTLIARCGRTLGEVVRELAELVHGPVSAACLEPDTAAMVAEGEVPAALYPGVVQSLSDAGR